ncbi:hypothetical protein J3R83DRAFT_8334 [Lanmaoa asiatica]|nr:hypothetical protein J3R83DRAFT_8334 [Lanmaoa asiatica]
MHNALLISEVFSCIVGYLVENTVQHPKSVNARDTRRAGRRALARLARTCRAFSEPALDAVWRRLHSLEPFLLCSVSYPDVIANGALSKQPSFDEKEWNIVLRYAPRVQELTLDELLSVNILQSLWFRTTLLLPNLRKLDWNYGDYTTIGSIRLLLSPSLVHLHVWLNDGDHYSVKGLLECYHTLCPNLKSLSFRHLGRFPQVTAAISRAISHSPNLETLACDPVSEAALIHIVGSRSLKKFSAKLLNYRPDDLRRLGDYGTPDHPPFENLRVLELCVEDLSSIIPYLKPHHQPFEEVLFDFRMLPAPEVFHELFAALSSAPRRGTLRQFRLHSLGMRKHGIPLQPIYFRVLSPLMTLNLHKFDVNLSNSVSLNDDELAQLVQAWPELETFNFNQYSGWDYASSFQMPTLRGLLLLLGRCPKLRHLGMCVNAKNIPSLSEDESLIRNTAITRLSFGNSPIHEPVASIAQFLLEHFPSLIALPMWIPTSGQPWHDYRRMWKEVDTFIQEINGRGSSPESSDDEME